MRARQFRPATYPARRRPADISPQEDRNSGHLLVRPLAGPCASRRPRRRPMCGSWVSWSPPRSLQTRISRSSSSPRPSTKAPPFHVLLFYGTLRIDLGDFMTSSEDTPSMAAVRELVDEYRTRCLWFLRSDYYPETLEEACEVLSQIERHGDVTAFRKASRLRQWLSPNSSASSAV